MDARIQASVYSDRYSFFNSLTESDTALAGHHWNVNPNIKMRGFYYLNSKWTSPMNLTSGVVNADKSAFFHFMSDRSILTNSFTGTNEIPFTVSSNSSRNGNAQIMHYYLKGASFICLTLTTSSPM